MRFDTHLEETLRYWISLAQSTFAQEQRDTEAVRNVVLMFFAGLGLARIDRPMSDNPVWVTAKSDVVDNYIGDKLSAVFGQYFVNQWSVLPSLNIILVEIVDRIRSSQPISRPEEQKRDEAMLWLAGTHFTLLIPDTRNGTLIWAPFYDLVWYFGSAEWRASIRMPKPGQLRFLSRRKLLDLVCEVRADRVLRAMLNGLREAVGADPADKITDFAHLFAMETHGEAIAYRDFDGGLAWKASEAFRHKTQEPVH